MSDVIIKDNSKEVLSELAYKLPTILEAVGLEAAGNSVDEISKLVYDTPESPNYVRTGRLRNSIAWATNENHAAVGIPHKAEDANPIENPETDAVYIGTNVEYAPYVEMGTSKMAARPFLRNAIANYGDDYKKIIEEGLKA